MLRLFGRRPDSRDGGTRRELLRVGALSLFGSMTTPRLLRAADSGGATRPGKARSVILFNLLGGPSHMDMFDLKPDWPRPRSAASSGRSPPRCPGLQICEHLPRTARLMHKACLIRSVTHAYNAHDPLPIMTGFTGGRPGAAPARADRPARHRRDLPVPRAWARATCRARSACRATRAGGRGAGTRHPPARALRRVPRAASTTRSSASASRPSTASRAAHTTTRSCPMGEPDAPGAGRPARADRRSPRPPPLAARPARRRLRRGRTRRPASRPDGSTSSSGRSPC